MRISVIFYFYFEFLYIKSNCVTFYLYSVLVSFQPGICFETLNQLNEFLSETDKDRNVVLMFDAMHVRQLLEYNSFSDSVSGVETVDSERRSDVYAQCLLVFMLRSILHGWTQIIGHHFTRSVFNKHSLKPLIESYLTALHASGLTCRAIICDQEPSHVSMFRAAGVSFDNPHIPCPVTGRKIYVVYDPPHLLKSARNNLLTSEFVVRLLEYLSFHKCC